jgi:hypothetical protein
MRSLSPALRYLALSAPLLTAACDTSSLAPAPRDAVSSVRYECSAEVRTRALSCVIPGTSRRAVILGGQNVNVRISTGNVAVVADTFGFDLKVHNLLQTAMGTQDGVTPDPSGVRVFLVDGVHTTSGSGQVTVANADGVDIFTASNQSYFAYPGIIAAHDSSAYKRWKLRFDPGVGSFSFSLLVSAAVPPGGGNVVVAIDSPANNTVVGDSVRVTARVVSAPASIASVEAILNGVTTPMSSVGGAPPTTVLHTAGLPDGTYPLRVRATTVNGDTGSATVNILRTTAEQGLVITRPEPGTVARPLLRIDAECLGCNRIQVRLLVPPFVVGDSMPLLASGVTSVHTDVSLAQWDGKHNLQLWILGRSASNGQTTLLTRDVAADSTSRISEGLSGRHRLIGFSSSVLLEARGYSPSSSTNTDYTHFSIIQVDRASGDSSVLIPDYTQGFARAYTGGWVIGNHYDLHNGVLSSIPTLNGLTSVSGDWAGWQEGANALVRRRNLAAGTTETVDSLAQQNAAPEVADNGDIVWAGMDRNIYRAHLGGPTQQLTSTATATSFMAQPITDGVNVAWIYVPQGLPKRLYLYTAAGQTIDLGDVAPNGSAYLFHTMYEVRNGWTAFIRPDAGGFRPVWTRAPDGTLRQVTFTGGHASLLALGKAGEVIYGFAGRAYSSHAPYTAPPLRLFGDQQPSQLRWADMQLLLVLGRTVFDVAY